MPGNPTRRELSAALALGLIGCDRAAARGGPKVSANEDLMREHGVLVRLMVVYEAAALRLERGERAMVEPIRSAAAIVRTFVEDYHERIEEQHVFPLLERANQLVELVAVLRRQHEAGRGLTDRITTLAQGDLASDADRAALAAALRGYASMFQPHIGREDTLVFPAFHQLAGRAYGELGETFEREEQARFGEGGFEHFVAQLPAIEVATGVAELAKLTVTVNDLRRS